MGLDLNLAEPLLLLNTHLKQHYNIPFRSASQIRPVLNNRKKLESEIIFKKKTRFP